MSALISPPDHIARDPEARACWHRVQEHLARRGEWRPEYQLGLEVLASAAAQYLRVARELQTRSDVPAAAAQKLEETRLQVRKMLAEFLVIQDARVPLALVSEDGLDSDIVTVCRPQTV